MTEVVITGTGLYVPKDKISNEELVKTFNIWVDRYNEENKEAIASGDLEAKKPSSAAFIEKASGIRARHIMEASGILDTNRMMSKLPDDAHGTEDTPCLQASMGLSAAKEAMQSAGITADMIDNIIFTSASPQRFFPALSIEIQHFLGAKGTASDMVMGCSSATYALIAGVNAIKAGTCDRVMVVNAEIFSTMVNFKDRDSHFIFGDIANAIIIEKKELADERDAPEQWRIFNTKSETKFSHNIRSSYGTLTRFEPENIHRKDMFFVQEGRKVFKELLPMVTNFIALHLEENNLNVTDLSRMWLHQANINMNNYAAKKLLGRDPEFNEAPTVLEEYGNTAGAGSVVAFHKHRSDLPTGALGLICSFGAGYSIGSLLIEKV